MRKLVIPWKNPGNSYFETRVSLFLAIFLVSLFQGYISFSGYKFKKTRVAHFMVTNLNFLTELQTAKSYDKETKTILINFNEKNMTKFAKDKISIFYLVFY